MSKIGYVELTDENGSRARERIVLRDGVGEGTMVLPSTLPTGYYRLVGYTRWMENEGIGVFFEKLIGVVNPASGEVVRGSADIEPPQIVPQGVVGSASTGGLGISTDRGAYSPRSEISVDISGIPADIHTLGVSVTAADLTGRYTRPALGEWRETLSGNAGPNGSALREAPFSGLHEVEYEGAIVTGKLVSPTTGETVYTPVVPLASFPGDEINFFSGRLDESGKVTFYTTHTEGFGDIVTSLDSPEIECRIDLDDPFSQAGIARPLPTFPAEAIDRTMMLRQSLAMQLQYSYINDSLTRRHSVAPRFHQSPDFSYKLEEWRRFATMHEVMTEFIKLVNFYRRDGKWTLSMFSSYFDLTRARPLVLLDGIPIVDHEIVYNYNPLLLDRIDIYSDRFMVGSNVFFGIVALYTADNNYPELHPDPFTQIVTYPSPQARRLFYVPDHSDASRGSNRLPDQRHTLYWNADVDADDGGHARVSFPASDLAGTYNVLVEGITTSGEPVSATYSIEVR